jgi:uncharacterized membrane protein
MAVTFSGNQKTASAGMRMLVALVAGILAAIVSGSLIRWRLAPLIGWDVAVLVYVSWIWLTIKRLANQQTADFALREDPSRGLADLLLVVASIASLAAVAVLLVGAGQASRSHALWYVGFGVVSVLLAWTLTHTIFMLRYAELYYKDPAHAVEFDGSNHQPTYADFAYLAFTMAMTFQVSDTGFQSTKFRSLALRHALLSYLFGTIIVATTINLVAGLIGSGS